MARRKKIVHAVQEIIPAEIKPAKCVNEERTNTIKASIAFDITRDLYERGRINTLRVEQGFPELTAEEFLARCRPKEITDETVAMLIKNDQRS